MPKVNPKDILSKQNWEEFKEAIQTKNPCREIPFSFNTQEQEEKLTNEIKALREEVREQNRRLSKIEFMLSLGKEEKKIWNAIAKSRSLYHGTFRS